MEHGDGDVAAAPLLTARLAIPVAVFLSSRLVTMAVAHVARLLKPQEIIAVLWRWDGQHYLEIARSGYPPSLEAGPDRGSQSVHAFFPGFPLMLRAVARVTGLALETSGVVTTVALATVASALIWLLARDLAGEEVATRAVLLFSFFPGSFVLGLIYSEGAFLAFAAGCLLALQRRRWVAAGLAAAAAGATRPTGLVLGLCCAWAAGEAVRRRRQWWALAAPALAPLGFVAWSVFLAVHTGSPTTWLRSQQRGWGQGFDFGAHTARSIGSFFAHPIVDFNRTVCVLTILVVAAGLGLLSRTRPPAAAWIYTAGILAPALLSAVLTSTPRFALTAFPLHIAAARSLTGTAFAVTLALSAAAMALLMLVAETSLLVTP
ncbi:MAG TPA: mannosyltransferase family protein [Acidimicrobiales bacterium]|nr:mannosyltransferase family protein [Acidimicrobiales bacterium]